MSDLNTRRDLAVWFDIPVADLDRACAFYAAVLAIEVQTESVGGVSFCVFAHDEGNGGCLVPAPDDAGAARGVLLYLNVDGRLRGALQQTEAYGGRVLQAAHPIGPHGWRALVLDSEGNRIALHSTVDA
jgi:predicted enzyme related to lactoylglutathione lyase